MNLLHFYMGHQKWQYVLVNYYIKWFDSGILKLEKWVDVDYGQSLLLNLCWNKHKQNLCLQINQGQRFNLPTIKDWFIEKVTKQSSKTPGNALAQVQRVHAPADL